MLLKVQTLRYEACDFSVWDNNGFGMLSPMGVRSDNAAMCELDFDTVFECAFDPCSNFAFDPEDSSEQDVPASEIACESPENDTTCEYHGVLQAAKDTEQMLFVAFEGRSIHVQQLLNIVLNSDMQAALHNYHPLLRNQQPASPQPILTTPKENDRVQPFDVFRTLVNYNDKECSISFCSVVKVMHAARQTFPTVAELEGSPYEIQCPFMPFEFWGDAGAVPWNGRFLQKVHNVCAADAHFVAPIATVERLWQFSQNDIEPVSRFLMHVPFPSAVPLVPYAVLGCAQYREQLRNALGAKRMPCPFPNCDRVFMHGSLRSHIAGHFLRGHWWAGQEGGDKGAFCVWCGNRDGKCSTNVHGNKVDNNCSLAYHQRGNPNGDEP